MKNKKRLLSVLTLFMCIALVSIGFAAWVITGDAKNTQSGNVEVTDVNDERLKIESPSLTVKKINFGAPETINDSKAWLKADGVAKEAMSTVLTFTINHNNQLDHIEVTLEPTTKATEYQNAITNGYIVAPVFEGRIEKIGVETTQAYSVTFTWTWGAKFSLDGASVGANPYTFFNGLKSEGTDIAGARKDLNPQKTNADFALEAMTALRLLNGVAFNVNIHAVSTAGTNQA